MSTKRLSVAQLQIYFDDHGAAQFSDNMKRDRAAAETALAEYRDFIDAWLDASQEKRPRYIPEEEREFRRTLNRLAQGLSRSRKFEMEFIKTVIREAAKYLGDRSPSLTPTQILESIEATISVL